MKTFLKRAWAAISLFISAVVLVLSLVTIIGIWIASSVATTSVVQFLTGTAATVKAASVNVSQVNAGVGKLQQQTTALGEAAAKLSQSPTDKSAILGLLPEAGQQTVDAVAGRVGERFGATNLFVGPMRTTIGALNHLPFVNIPDPDAALADTVQGQMNDLTGSAPALDKAASEVLANAPNAAGHVAAAADRVNSVIGSVQTPLTQLEGQLAEIETRTTRLANFVSFLFTVGSTIGTIFLIWVIYSQVIVLRHAWSGLRRPRKETVAVVEGAAQE
ncbi:MAG: hypothetical protein U0768_09325 [Anaerolineae bacterium]